MGSNECQLHHCVPCVAHKDIVCTCSFVIVRDFSHTLCPSHWRIHSSWNVSKMLSFYSIILMGSTRSTLVYHHPPSTFEAESLRGRCFFKHWVPSDAFVYICLYTVVFIAFRLWFGLSYSVFAMPANLRKCQFGSLRSLWQLHMAPWFCAVEFLGQQNTAVKVNGICLWHIWQFCSNYCIITHNVIHNYMWTYACSPDLAGTYICACVWPSETMAAIWMCNNH